MAREKSLIKDEKGQALILVAAAMVVLLGMAAFTIDMGLVFYQRRQLQNAADAAVLAGAREMIDGNDVTEQVEKYVMLHGYSADAVESITAEGTHITVVLSFEQQLFFIRLLGFDSSDIPARATAEIGPIITTTGIRPLGMPWSVYEEAQNNPDGIGFAFQTFGPGSWGFVYFPGDDHQSQTVADRMKDGYPNRINVGDDINIIRGHAPAVKCEPYIDKYIAEGTILIIPILEDWDDDPGLGHRPVTVLGFAAVQLTNLEGKGGNYILSGRFINTIGVGEIGQSTNYGLYGLQLTN